MSIITQYSRISHHTVTTSGLTGTTFTVPASEDFTAVGVWTNYDLALSEIGVDEDRNKAYMRIGSNINEFNFRSDTNKGTVILGSAGVSGSYTVVHSDALPTSNIQVTAYASHTGNIYVTRNTGSFIISSSEPTDNIEVGWELN